MMMIHLTLSAKGNMTKTCPCLEYHPLKPFDEKWHVYDFPHLNVTNRFHSIPHPYPDLIFYLTTTINKDFPRHNRILYRRDMQFLMNIPWHVSYLYTNTLLGVGQHEVFL